MEDQVSGILVRALADVLRQRGVAPERLLGGSAEQIFLAPFERRLPLADYQGLLERAIQLTGDPALGLSCGLQAAESSFGLWGPLVSHAETLRHAVRLIQQFHPLMLEQTRLHLTEQLGAARLSCDFPRTHNPADRSIAELIVAGFVRTLRSFGCAREDMHAVHFEHKTPAHYYAYAEAFGCEVHFGAAFTGVTFCATALDRLHIHRQPELQTLVHAQAERYLSLLSRPQSYSDRVIALLRRQRSGGHPQLSDAARSLGVSSRSLRRRLLDEGTSYRSLLQSILRDSACAMLRDRDRSIQSISRALGFNNSTAFQRAFKRWVNLTPAEYRDTTLPTPSTPTSPSPS